MIGSTKKKQDKPLVVIVTGLSGAGLSSALNVLQDNGFYCIDNLPIALLEHTIEFTVLRGSSEVGYAFGMDIRDHRFAAEFPEIKEKFKKTLRLDIIFLSSDESVLHDRYSSTRRKHPLLTNSKNLIEAIRAEEKLLRPVQKAADAVLDTSLWSPQLLQHHLEQRFQRHMTSRTLYVTISSFGFKHGQLRPAESIIDIRFLKNPYFFPQLKDKSGLEAAVKKFIFDDSLSKETFKRLEAWFRFMLPNYYKEGKHFFRIGIGCTGGRHRSVAFAERLAEVLKAKPIKNTEISVIHRDIDL